MRATAAAAALLFLAAPWLAATALAVAHDAPANDLIVLVQPDAHVPLPVDAWPLTVVPGFVVPNAPPALEQALTHHPDVVRLQRAQPLAYHDLPRPTTAAPGDAPGNLHHRLTRADAPDALTGRGITVAIVDSGIDGTHPDLVGRVKANHRLVQGKFLEAPGDAGGHGTHVAGVIAASGASSDGRWAGVAPEAELVGIDISDRFTTASAILAYDWMYVHRHEHDIRIVVNAWGRVGDEPFDPDDAVIRAIDRLVASGVVVLFSASNHGPDPASLSMEAQDPWVVTVGAVDPAARLMDYSSRGPLRHIDGPEHVTWVKPDLMAPGEGVVSLKSTQSPPESSDPDPLHRILSGTSQAVPHVAGIVARMLQANASLTPVEVANALRESTIDLGAPGPDHETGFGLIDAHDAGRRARGLDPDRQNPLVIGGTERYRREADLSATPRGSLLGLTQRAEELVTLDFVVKPDAERLTYAIRTSAPIEQATLTLERDGRTVHRDGRLDGALQTPEPGVWRLRVRGVAPSATDAAAIVDVHLPPHPERALELDARHRFIPEALPTAAPADTGFAAFATQARLFLTAYPGAAPMLAAGFIFALAFRPPHRPQAPERRVIVLEAWPHDETTIHEGEDPQA